MHKLISFSSAVLLATMLYAPVATAQNDSERPSAQDRKPKAVRFEAKGVITALDATAGAITIKGVRGSKAVRGKSQIVITTNADTKIRKDGKAAAFVDLKTGNKVEANGMVDGDKFIAKKVHARSVKFELAGEVKSLDAAAKKVTVTVKRGNAPVREFKNKDVVILYNDATKLVLRKGVATVGDLKAGVRVNIKGIIETDQWLASRITVVGVLAPKPHDDDDDEVKTTAAVEITANGFAPATVKVKAGGTVTWTNKDSALHQPASDPHPAHTTVPGFDAGSGLAQNATYSFTFSTAGTWGYHDNLNPSLTGTVQVVQ